MDGIADEEDEVAFELMALEAVLATTMQIGRKNMCPVSRTE